LKAHFAQFWGIHVTGFNPKPYSRPRLYTEPSILQVPGIEIVNDVISLSSAVNYVQNYVHDRKYCLRENKTTKEQEFYPAQNDGMVNKYNHVTTMA
jgi:hypothetical protein